MRPIRLLLSQKFSSNSWYLKLHKIVDHYIRRPKRVIQVSLSELGKRVGLSIVWTRFGALSNFHEGRYLVMSGFHGITYVGQSLYLSRKYVRLKFRSDPRLVPYLQNITCQGNSNLVPVSFLEAALVKEGTFQIRRRISLKRDCRTHILGETGTIIKIPENYNHFGHFLPQLIPFFLRQQKNRFAMNLSDPDDFNRNMEILEFYSISIARQQRDFPRLVSTLEARQVDLYPAKNELELIRSKLLSKVDKRDGQNHSHPSKIYLTRRNAAAGRRVINEAELIQTLNTLGFQSLDTSELDYHTSLQIFSRAEFVIGAFGSSFFHALSVPQECKLIELQGTELIRWHGKKMAVDLGFDYETIICETLENLDIVVDINSLVSKVNSE